MKKKQITKLFAVMAMAASPAAGNPATDPWGVVAAPFTPDDRVRALEAVISMGFAALARAREASAPDIAIARAPSPNAPGPAVVARPTTSLVAPALSAAVARPRTTPSGAPACGNVASRASRSVECSPRSVAPVLADAPAPAPHVATPPAAGGAE